MAVILKTDGTRGSMYNLSLEEKETLLSQIKADVYKLEGRIAEKKSIFAYLVNLIDKEQGIYGKKRCIK